MYVLNNCKNNHKDKVLPSDILWPPHNCDTITNHTQITPARTHTVHMLSVSGASTSDHPLNGNNLSTNLQDQIIDIPVIITPSTKLNVTSKFPNMYFIKNNICLDSTVFSSFRLNISDLVADCRLKLKNYTTPSQITELATLFYFTVKCNTPYIDKVNLQIHHNVVNISLTPTSPHETPLKQNVTFYFQIMVKLNPNLTTYNSAITGHDQRKFVIHRFNFDKLNCLFGSSDSLKITHSNKLIYDQISMPNPYSTICFPAVCPVLLNANSQSIKFTNSSPIPNFYSQRQSANIFSNRMLTHIKYDEWMYLHDDHNNANFSTTFLSQEDLKPGNFLPIENIINQLKIQTLPTDLQILKALTPITTKHKVLVALQNNHWHGSIKLCVYKNGLKIRFPDDSQSSTHCNTPTMCSRIPLEINIHHTSNVTPNTCTTQQIKHEIKSAKIVDAAVVTLALREFQYDMYDLYYPPFDGQTKMPSKKVRKAHNYNNLTDMGPYHTFIPISTPQNAKPVTPITKPLCPQTSTESVFSLQSNLSRLLIQKKMEFPKSPLLENLSIFALTKQLYVENEKYNTKISSSPKLFARFHVLAEKKKWETVVGLFDTGSDISLMEEACMHRLFSESYVKTHLVKAKTNVNSFTNNQIVITGILYIEITFDIQQERQIVPFMIYQGTTTNILIGTDIINLFKISLQHTSNHVPTLYTNNKQLTSFYIAPEHIDTCYGHFRLEPFERKMFYFDVSPAFVLVANEKILVYEKFEEKFFISATLSPYLNRCKVAVAITNRTDTKINKKIRLSIKPVPANHEIFDQNNWPPPKSCLLLKPIVNTVENELRTLKVFRISKTKSASIFRINAHTTPAVQGFHTPGYTKKSDTTKPVFAAPNNDKNEMDELDDDILETAQYEKYQPKGYEIPIFSQIEDVITLKDYPPIIRRYVKDIFFDKYKDVISLHPYHIGSISDTLGFVKLELKENASLPPFKRIYYLAETENKHLKDILDYLTAADVIVRCGVNDGSPFSGFSSPAYLIEKSCPESSSFRLIINYQFINSQIHTSPPVLPSMTKMLQNLHGAFLFSNFDLSSAFYCLTLEKKSRPITRFTCAQGSYEFKRLPMGMAISPSVFLETAERILNYEPILDKTGNAKRDEDNVVQLETSPIDNCSIFFDDIIVYTKYEKSLEKTYENHFKTIERVIKRLHFHKCKLSWSKTKLCKTEIKFLGWVVSQNVIKPDEDRIKRLLNCPFPATKKGQRAFLGLLNTLRQITPGNLISEMNVLSPLTSSTKSYKPEEKHLVAFEKIKTLLTTTPLYTNLIDPLGKFYLFSDASTSELSSYSAVLGQIQRSEQTYVPNHFNLNDPIHKFLFENEHQYRPIPLYLGNTSIPKTKCDIANFNPKLDVHYFSDKFLNYGENYTNSLFISIRSILYHYQAKFPDELELRKSTVKNLKPSIAFYQLKNDVFNGSTNELKDFLHKFETTVGAPGDEYFHIVKSLAEVLKRKIIIILDNENTKTAFRYFFEKDQKPAIVLGCYRTEKGFIYRPFVSTIFDTFNIQEFQKRLQICYFYSKTIPQAEKSKCILTLEIQGILKALEYFKPLLKLAELTILSDSRSFFCLFNQRVQKHHVLIERYATRMKQEFPGVKLRFLTSGDNIADFLSRQYSITQTDFKRIPLKYFQLSKHIVTTIADRKEFTLDEWESFVEENDNLLHSDQSSHISKSTFCLNSTHPSVWAITKQDNQFKISNHLSEMLEKATDRNNLMSEQKKLYPQLILDCTAGDNFQTTMNNQKYRLNNGLLMLVSDHVEKIVMPSSIEGTFLVLNHILRFHCGKDKLILASEQYYIEHLDAKVRKLLGSCYSCILNNSIKSPAHGRVPISSYAGESLALDLAENLEPCMSYRHILVITDIFSNFTLTFPLRTKTSNAILVPVLFLIYLNYGVKNLISDNAACFSSKRFLETLRLLNIKKIFISPRNPQGNSNCEKNVHILKLALRKYLATEDNNNWVQKLALISRAYNTTPNPIHGYSPFQILYGHSSPHARNNFFNSDLLNNQYPNISPHDMDKEIHKINAIVKEAKLRTQDHRQMTRNKHLASPKFYINDFCLLKDEYRVIGTTRPLKSKYSPTIYTVVKVNSKSLVLQNLTTGQTSLHSMRHAKKISHNNISKIELSDEIKQILLKDFIDLSKNDVRIISKNTNITIHDPPENWLLKDDNEQHDISNDHQDDQVDEIEETHEDDITHNLRPRKVHFQYSK